MAVSDVVGSIGVSLLLLAFLLNLFNKISKDGLAYILLNICGGGLAFMASCMLHYIPFIVLEGAWTIVSIIALIKFLKINT
ncbi:MAG: hypothetical protein H0W12_02235 [Chitinophagaceae bacterium]|nr:hypothetical protein [Chitinophagaceae bacterium]